MNSQKLYTLIYESTINPGGYDALIQEWNTYLELEHIPEELTLRNSSPDSTEELADFHSHLVRAEAIIDEIGRSQILQPLPTPTEQLTAIVSEDGRIVSSNRAAQNHFGRDFNLGSIYDACDADSAIKLRNALHKMNDYRPGQFVTLLTLPADEALEKTTQYLAVTMCTELAGRRRALALASMVIPWSQAVAAELTKIFKLTFAEVELCRMLVEGLALSQIAAAKERSIETIRVQLKAVFRKTYSKSQTELLRTMMMLATIIKNSPIDKLYHQPEDQMEVLTLPDGRAMTLRYFGDEHGAPVLFLHGMMDAFGGPKRMSKELKNAGLRFICPARAGFGEADPLAISGKNAQRMITSDLVYLADQLGLKRCAILGHLSGGAYAFSLASALGSRAASIINVSGAVPIRKLSQITAMPARQKVIALTARYFPNILLPLLRIGMSQINTEHCEAFVRALFPSGTPDSKLIEKLALYETFEEQYRWSTQNGYDGFKLDSSVVTVDWFRKSKRVSCPVTWLHGQHDFVVKHDSAKRFAFLLDSVTFHSFPESGQLLLYSHPKRVISEILKSL